ncbi:MAG: ABC transporter permease [Chlamydiales bacterium]|jgi:oligopeptide transport system permease protein|nr:ABC transporter permease [Chlamydiales bacterium]
MNTEELFTPLTTIERARLLDEKEEMPNVSALRQAWNQLVKKKSALLGLSLFILLVIMAMIGPYLSPYKYYEINLPLRNQPPCRNYWFGTDDLGRDLFTRCWWGARISFFVGISASIIDLIIGVLYGVCAGFLGKKIEMRMMRMLDIFYSIPYLLFIILLITVIGSGIGTIILSLALIGWVNMARIVRSQILQIKQQGYVQAAFALGATHWHIMRKHLIPNAVGSIMVTLTLTVPWAIFVEAFLSFLGLGVQAPTASLGMMIHDGLYAIRYYPWRLIAPAACISLSLLSLNLLAEGLREVLNPRHMQ